MFGCVSKLDKVNVGHLAHTFLCEFALWQVWYLPVADPGYIKGGGAGVDGALFSSLGLVQTSHLTCAESNANELKQ
jgi:hypothetical protein